MVLSQNVGSKVTNVHGVCFNVDKKKVFRRSQSDSKFWRRYFEIVSAGENIWWTSLSEFLERMPQKFLHSIGWKNSWEVSDFLNSKTNCFSPSSILTGLQSWSICEKKQEIHSHFLAVIDAWGSICKETALHFWKSFCFILKYIIKIFQTYQLE